MKRFYKAASIGAVENGFEVLLDGRPVRTHAKAPLLLPVEGLAVEIAAEWNAQEEKIVPGSMPFMSLAATGIDRVAPQRDAVIDQIVAYGGSDLVCYRAEDPEDLVARQANYWQPLLDWCRERFGAELAVTTGVMPLSQSEEALAALRGGIVAHTDLVLSGLYQLTTGFGSLVISLAVLEGRIGVEKGIEYALLDELFQNGRWGEDKEALDRRNGMVTDMKNAARFISFCRV